MLEHSIVKMDLGFHRMLWSRCWKGWRNKWGWQAVICEQAMRPSGRVCWHEARAENGDNQWAHACGGVNQTPNWNRTHRKEGEGADDLFSSFPCPCPFLLLLSLMTPLPPLPKDDWKHISQTLTMVVSEDVLTFYLFSFHRLHFYNEHTHVKIKKKTLLCVVERNESLHQTSTVTRKRPTAYKVNYTSHCIQHRSVPSSWTGCSEDWVLGKQPLQFPVRALICDEMLRACILASIRGRSMAPSCPWHWYFNTTALIQVSTYLAESIRLWEIRRVCLIVRIPTEEWRAIISQVLPGPRACFSF